MTTNKGVNPLKPPKEYGGFKRDEVPFPFPFPFSFNRFKNIIYIYYIFDVIIII